MTARTPENRSKEIERVNRKARKSYRPKIDRSRKLTPDELAVIKDMVVSLKLVAYSNSQIASIVGVGKKQVKEILEDGNVQKRITALQSKIPEAAINLGKAALVEAVMGVLHVLRTTNDEQYILKAAAELFDRFGIPKVSRTENKNENPPGGLPLEDDLMSMLRQASPEIQEKVAALHESFLNGALTIIESAKEENGPVDET